MIILLKVIDIKVRKHIDYYNMLDIVMIEIEETGRGKQNKRGIKKSI